MWTIHIHCKNWKTVFNRKLTLLQDELFCVLRNIFRRCEAYLEAGQHYICSVKQVELQGEDGLWIRGHCGLLVVLCVCMRAFVCVCVWCMCARVCVCVCVCVYIYTEVPMTPAWLSDMICGIFCFINGGRVEERSQLVLNNWFYIVLYSGEIRQTLTRIKFG